MKNLISILFLLFYYNLQSKELTDIIGHIQSYKTDNDETLVDIARSNNLQLFLKLCLPILT